MKPLTGSLALALALIAGVANAQTTDDLRRLPVPPVDTSGLPVTVLRGGTLIADPLRPAIPNAVVVIRGDRIIAAGPIASTTISAHPAKVIDTTGLTMMPGLIDLHVHFTAQRGKDFGAYPDSDATAAIRGTVLARQLVGAGITAVRDVGTTHDIALRLKQAVARHIITGPRIFWSGQIIATTGGHGDEVTSTGTGREKSGSDGSSSRRIADGPWEWRIAVRGQLRATADWIKIAAPFDKEEVSAAIDEAHQQGARVAVDSFGPYTDMAIEAGVDSLEHPLAMSAQAVPLMIKHHTAFVPTLVAFNNLLTTGYPSAGIPAGGFFYTRSRRFTIDQATHLRRVGEAWRAGVPIGVGTDIPFEGDTRYPEAYFLELDYLKQAGMPNRDVLASATSTGARILGLDDKLGTIAPDHLADILVIEGNPIEDLRNLRRIKFVMAGGQTLAAP